MMDYDVFGKTADNRNILLYTANDKTTAECVYNTFSDLVRERMLIKDGVYIDEISVSAEVDFHACLYVGVNEVFNDLNVTELVRENIKQNDVLLDEVSMADEEVGNILRDFMEFTGEEKLMEFITVDVNKVHYSAEESFGETLGYVVPCKFDVIKFLKVAEHDFGG